MRTSKQELLEHYSQKEPVEFIQFDAFGNPECFDSIIAPDEDGISLFAGESFDLMSGIWDVRVLITRERIDKQKTIRMLKKIIDWIETADRLEEYFIPHEDTPKEKLLKKLRIIRSANRDCDHDGIPF